MLVSTKQTKATCNCDLHVKCLTKCVGGLAQRERKSNSCDLHVKCLTNACEALHKERISKRSSQGTKKSYKKKIIDPVQSRWSVPHIKPGTELKITDSIFLELETILVPLGTTKNQPI